MDNTPTSPKTAKRTTIGFIAAFAIIGLGFIAMYS